MDDWMRFCLLVSVLMLMTGAITRQGSFLFISFIWLLLAITIQIIDTYLAIKRHEAINEEMQEYLETRGRGRPLRRRILR